MEFLKFLISREKPLIFNKGQNMLLGVAIGDAFGAGYEGQK